MTKVQKSIKVISYNRPNHKGDETNKNIYKKILDSFLLKIELFLFYIID